MKETHIFYAPDYTPANATLPADEAAHAVRVLRMREGDEILVADGRGTFYKAAITLATPKRCETAVQDSWADTKLWQGEIRLAVAPTKNMDRLEWFAEKATEIGVDRISLLNCDFSERKVVKTERLERIVVSAMKQSHKAFKPIVDEMVPFRQFVSQPFDGQKFIAHCYSPEEVDDAGQAVHLSGRNFLGDKVGATDASLVLIGPEGDFGIEEVNYAISQGFQPISLGESRLRTETAALVAVHLMYLAKRVK